MEIMELVVFIISTKGMVVDIILELMVTTSIVVVELVMIYQHKGCCG